MSSPSVLPSSTPGPVVRRPAHAGTTDVLGFKHDGRGRAYPGRVSEVARIVLMTREGCHLCERARAVVARVAQEQGVEWAEQDVDSDQALRAAYGDEVPVVLLDGARHSQFVVDAAALVQALRPGRTGALRWLRR